MIKMLILLLSPILFASESEVEKYCFPGMTGHQASAKFEAIRVPSDKVTQENNCLTIQMSEHRRELIQRYLLANGASLSFSSVNVKREPCKLKVEKVKTHDKKNTNISLESASVTTEKVNATETLQIETLKEFSLTVGQSEINGECNFVNQNRYDLEIEVRRNPVPLVPVALPPGTIAVINPPPDQETSILKTQLQLNRGERIELGSVVKNLTNNSHKTDVRPELKVESSDQNHSEKVFLSIQ